MKDKWQILNSKFSYSLSKYGGGEKRLWNEIFSFVPLKWDGKLLRQFAGC